MAGSRTEKLGTIYTRLQGLLRSGAMKEADKPIWCEVYEAFPPRDPPLYERAIPEKKIPQILYPEDIIRTQFYKTYGNPDVVDLTNQRIKTTCQKFVEKYLELLKTDTPKETLFEATVTALKQQGLRLRTVEEVKESIAKQSETRFATQPPKLEPEKFSVANIFGEQTVKRKQNEEQDYFSDDEDNRSPKL